MVAGDDAVRHLLIRLLFRLLDVPRISKDELEDKQEHMNRWLAESYSSLGALAYFAKRDRELMWDLSGGKYVPQRLQEQYIGNIGRRTELHQWRMDCMTAWAELKKQSGKPKKFVTVVK